MPIFGDTFFDELFGGKTEIKDGGIISARAHFFVGDADMAVVSDMDQETIYKKMMRKYKLEKAPDISQAGGNLIAGIALFFVELFLFIGILLPIYSTGLWERVFSAALLLTAAVAILPAAAVIEIVKRMKRKAEMKAAINTGAYCVYNCKVENKTVRRVRSRHNISYYYYLYLNGAMVNVKSSIYGISDIGSVVRCVVLEGEKHRYLLVLDN